MGFTDFFSKAWHYVASKAKGAVTSLKDGAKHVWNAVKEQTKRVAQAVKSTTSKAVHLVTEAAKSVGKGASIVFQKAESVVQTVYTDVVKKPLQAAEDTWANISKGFSSPLTWLALGLGAVIVVPALIRR